MYIQHSMDGPSCQSLEWDTLNIAYLGRLSMLLSALIGDNIGSNEDFRRGGPYEAAASF